MALRHRPRPRPASKLHGTRLLQGSADHSRLTVTATPFIESLVMPHPVVMDPQTHAPIVPIIPSTLSPLKDALQPRVRNAASLLQQLRVAAGAAIAVAWLR
jgi:hypothetical protein